MVFDKISAECFQKRSIEEAERGERYVSFSSRKSCSMTNSQSAVI